MQVKVTKPYECPLRNDCCCGVGWVCTEDYVFPNNCPLVEGVQVIREETTHA